MKFNAGNAQHVGARQQQQDSFGFSDPGDKASVGHGGFLGVVADGMGGLTHGQEASATAVRAFLAAYGAKTPKECVVDALSRSLMEANRAVLAMLDGGSSEAGTTLVAAVVVEEKLYWISAGDSRIYWLHNNELTRLTADHIYAAKLNRDVALGRISRSDALNHPEQASLTSYLGQPQPALVDRNLRPLLLHENECVLLCSDGFYRGLSDAEITAHFQGNPQNACDALVEVVLAKDRKQQDNLTVIALKAGADSRRLVDLSIGARLSVLAAVCLVLLSIAGGYWFARRSAFWSTSSPSVQKGSPPPPVTVSQPPAAQPPISSPPASPVAPAAKRADSGVDNSTPSPAKKNGSASKNTTHASAGHELTNTPAASGSARPHPGTAAGGSSKPARSPKDQQNRNSPAPDNAPNPTVQPGESNPSSPAPPPPQPPDPSPPAPQSGHIVTMADCVVAMARSIDERKETICYALYN